MHNRPPTKCTSRRSSSASLRRMFMAPGVLRWQFDWPKDPGMEERIEDPLGVQIVPFLSIDHDCELHSEFHANHRKSLVTFW